MLNTGVGPTINHKQKQSSYLQKKQANALAFPRFPMYPSNNQYRPPMTNLPLQMNTINLPRTKETGMMPNMPQIQQQLSNMKTENLPGSNIKKMDSPFVMEKDIALSPSPSKLLGVRRETDIRGDQPSTHFPVSENIMTMNSPAQSVGDNKGLSNASMMMKMNEKELAKASDISTVSLKVGSLSFKNCKITTKIHYGKRQITWEVSDIKSSGKDSMTEKTPSKRKFEVQFSDIEKIDINTNKNSITIETKEKPQEYKEYNQASKKASQWLRDDDSESEMSEDISAINGHFIIEAYYPKDALTKNLAGKPSQLDKLMRSGLPLTINGKPNEFSTETPNKMPSMSLVPGDDLLHSQLQTPQRQGNPTSQMGRGPPGDDIRFPSMDISHSNQFRRGNMNLRGGPQMFQNDPLQILNSENETMMEEPSLKGGMGGEEEEEEDDDEKEFPPLTKERKLEAQKFEAQLKTMKAEEKAEIILETIKPKRFGINPNSKKIYKCPIYKCSYQKNTANLLKNHLSQKHKELINMGFGMDDSGMFTWKPEAIDFVLMVTKLYPRFVKNIIRETKQT